MHRSLLIFISIIALTSGKVIRYKLCDEQGDYEADVSEVDAIPCTSEPCNVQQGHNYTIGIDFKLKSSSPAIHAVKIDIHGIIAGLPVPFPAPHTDGCKDCGLTCPLAPGTAYKFAATLAVLKEYPTIKLTAKWELVDENNKDIVCILIPLAIIPEKKVN